MGATADCINVKASDVFITLLTKDKPDDDDCPRFRKASEEYKLTEVGYLIDYMLPRLKAYENDRKRRRGGYVLPPEGVAGSVGLWIDHIMDTIHVKAERVHYTLAKLNPPSETMTAQEAVLTPEQRETTCSMFGAVMEVFEMKSCRVPVEGVAGIPALDLRMSEKRIRLGGLSLFIATGVEHVLGNPCDLSTFAHADQLLVDPAEVSVTLLLPPVMQVVMQPSLKYLAMKRVGLSLCIESNLSVKLKSSHVAHLSAILNNIYLYKQRTDAFWYWGGFKDSLVPVVEDPEKQDQYVSNWSAWKLMQEQSLYNSLFARCLLLRFPLFFFGHPDVKPSFLLSPLSQT
jgi:hypothetical protein